LSNLVLFNSEGCLTRPALTVTTT